MRAADKDDISYTDFVTRLVRAQWQAQQDFPICPTPDEPGTCNVYAELRFPPDIYENINEFWEERAEAENSSN